MRFSILLLTFLIFLQMDTNAEELNIWIGTAGDNGIYHLILDAEKGKLSEPSQVAELPGAGFLILNREGDKLYSAGRDERGQGKVVAFSIVKNNPVELKELNSQIVPNGHHPTHVNFDREFNFLMSAHYGGSTVNVFAVDAEGKLGAAVASIQHKGGSKVVGRRQDRPHPHWIGADTTNSIVAVPDLGLDQVVIYDFDSKTGKLGTSKLWAIPPGGGPRHMKFHENGKYAYVLNEFSLTVSVFERTSGNDFEKIQDIESLPDNLRDKRLNSAAEIRIHPSGKFLYTSSRGHDSITIYSIDQTSGKLTFVDRESVRGSWPRNFDVDASGKWMVVAGRYSNTISLFEIENDGTLQFTRKIVNVPGPICVAIER